MNILYIFAKIVKKLRGTSILDSNIHSKSKVHSGCLVVNSNLDRHSYCGYDCTILNSDIGPFCSIANNVSIGGAQHPLEYVSTSPVFLSHKDSLRVKFSHHNYLPAPRTIVMPDVWIGQGALIKGGIIIGTGAVVGMGAVVTKDVAAYSVVAGNPARTIKMRFDDETIEQLLKSKWWELDEARLYELGGYFNCPQKFLLKLNSL